MIQATGPPMASNDRGHSGVGIGSGRRARRGTVHTRSGGMGRGIGTTGRSAGVATGGRVFHWNDAVSSGVGTGG